MADGEMSHLRQLMLADDDETETTHTEGGDGERAEDLLDQDSSLNKTPLGTSIHTLMDKWMELLRNFSMRVNEEATSPEHIKEQAEISVKNVSVCEVEPCLKFRDACLDVATEFAKVGAEWQRHNPVASYKEEAASLQEATTRQATLIARTQGALEKKTADLKASIET